LTVELKQKIVFRPSYSKNETFLKKQNIFSLTSCFTKRAALDLFFTYITYTQK